MTLTPFLRTRALPALALTFLAGLLPVSAETGDPVLVNEVLASHTGTDDTEYVELYGIPGSPLEGLSLIVVESDAFAAGTIDRRIDFEPGQRLGANGFFLIGNPSGLNANYGVEPNLAIGNNFFENSSLTLALVETASLSGDQVSGNELVRDSVALDDGDEGDTFFFDAPVIGPDGPFFPAGARRLADGVDTDTAADWVIADFFLGGANTPVGGDPPPPLVATIMDIQGAGQRSPLEGERVETRGVVTLLAEGRDDFFLQDLEGDGDPSTSDGVLVSVRRLPSGIERPRVGDLVRLVSRVDELQFGDALPRTQLSGVGELELLGSGQTLPEPIEIKQLPDVSIEEAIEELEPLEGMLVTLRRGRVVAATSRFGEFAMLAEGNRKPGSGYFPQTSALLLRSLGPNEVDYNPERILVDDATLEDPILVSPGDRVFDFVGALDYTFGNYKLQPALVGRIQRTIVGGTPVSRRSGPPGDFRVTSFNVENLFDLVDEPGKDDEGSTPTPEELAIKLDKLATAIVVELDAPEIVVVQETENSAILQQVGDRVNEVVDTSYRAVSFETSDGRGIEVAFLYDEMRVELLEAFQLAGDDVEAAFGPSSASPGREPLVGRFSAKGRELVIVGNHFKSKGGDDPLFGVAWPPVRVTEEQRKLQAAAVRRYVDELFNEDPSALVLVTGDLNDFEFGEPGEGTDHPLAILEGEGAEVPLENLVLRVPKAERYTFVFDGNSQVLDHSLVSPSLAELVAGVDILHFNAPFPAALSSIPGSALRASDHDAVEVRLLLGASPAR